MDNFTPENFRKPTEPRVSDPGVGGNKVMGKKETGLDRYNRERREKAQARRDSEEQRRKDEELIRLAVKRYKRAAESESDNRAKALEDLKFKAGDQWPAEVRAQRMADKRPCLTINSIPTFTHQIENDIRQNRPGINISATGMKSNNESAEIFSGLIRAIERNSAAEIAYDTAAISAIDIGFGYIRILTEFENESSFDQVIVIRRVRNSFTVLLDPERQEPDGCDAKWGFVSEMVDRDEYKEKWPDASEVAWNERATGQDLKHWITRDQIRIAEYFTVDHEMKKLVRLSNGHVGYEDDLADSVKDLISMGSLTVEQEREVECQKVMWYRITAEDVLERQEWLGKWIPIIEVIGDEIDIEGRVDRFGVIRNAKNPARMKNYWSTAKAEFIALQPKSPWIGPEGSFDGHENEWKVSNVKSMPYMEYVPVLLENGQYAQPPTRQMAPQVPQGYVEAEQAAQQDMMRTTGIRFDASLSERVYDESGKALHELRGLNDIGSAHYADNLKRSLRFVGRQLVDLIPKISPSARMFSILKEDGTDALVKVDPTAPKAIGRLNQGQNEPPLKVFNPNIGEYEVTVTIGPSYATRRIEAQEQITKLAQSLPQSAMILAPLIAKYSDWPGANEAYKMLLASLPPGVQSVETNNLPPAVQAMIQSLQQKIAQLTGERQMMLKDLTDQAADRALKAKDLDTKQDKVNKDFEAKLLKMIADADVERKQFYSKLEDGLRTMNQKPEPEQRKQEPIGKSDITALASTLSSSLKTAEDEEARRGEDRVAQQKLNDRLVGAIELIASPKETTLIRGKDGRALKSRTEIASRKGLQ
jgi:hypothetical protein